jgi:hypothetical protein
MLSRMGFGYKTSWIAVKDRTASEVALALGLTDLEETDWAAGVGRAYFEGVFVSEAADGWTLAHSGLSLPDDSADFPGWLSELSSQLGVVQFFVNYRSNDYFAWFWAADGELIRGFATADAGPFLQIGNPTSAEQDLGERLNEDTVLSVAGEWSVNPVALEGPSGLFGLLAVESVSPQAAAARAYIAQMRRQRGF